MVWGVDIGKAALKAVKLRQLRDGLEIQAIEYIPYPVEEDEDERQEHVNDAIRNFLTKHKMNEPVIIGIPGLQAFSRFISLPPVERSKVGMMVRMEAQQQIPFPIDEVNWDYTVLPKDDDDDEIEVGIFATRSELIDGFLGDLAESTLSPDVVTIAPLAVYNFVRYNVDDQDGGTIILDIGAEHTDLVIIDGDRFWIRNLRIAGNDVTKALADRFKIPFAEAEKLKRSSAKSQQAKKIFSSMEGTLKDLCGEIHRSVGFFKSQAEDLDVQRILLLGDGSRLKNLPKFLKQQLKMNVKRVQRLEQDKFVIDEGVDLDVLSKHLPGFGVALGLAVQGVREAACAINLAPQELQIQAKLRSKLPFAIATAACAWAALFLTHRFYDTNKAKLQKTNKSVARIAQYQQIQEQARTALIPVKPKEQEAEPYKTVATRRTLALGVMDTIQKVLKDAADKNASLPPIDRKQPADRILEEYENKIRKVNQNKTWLLDFVFERKASTQEALPPFAVKLKIAKPLAGGDKKSIRDEIEKQIANPIRDALKAEPYYVRASKTKYGKVTVGSSETVYGPHPDAQEGDLPPQTQVECVMVTISFEVGAPPPKPKPKPGQPGQPGQPQPQ